VFQIATRVLQPLRRAGTDLAVSEPHVTASHSAVGTVDVLATPRFFPSALRSV
jgi:hypothetical protein